MYKDPNKLNEAALVQYLHRANPSYLKYEYLDMLHTLSEVMYEIMLEGKQFKIKNFGTFGTLPMKELHVKWRGGVHFIPATVRPHFRFSKVFTQKFKKKLKEKTTNAETTTDQNS